VLLVFGKQELPWAAICMMFLRFEKMEDERNNSEYYRPISESISFIMKSTAVRVWRHQINRKDHQKIAPLETLLNSYRSSQCEAFHDKVYALASLATDGLFEIDYSISAPELFSRVLTTILRANKLSLRSWHDFAEDCSFQIPSGSTPNPLADLQLAPELTPVIYRTTCPLSVVSDRKRYGRDLYFEEIAMKDLDHRLIQVVLPAIRKLYEDLESRAAITFNPNCDLSKSSVCALESEVLADVHRLFSDQDEVLADIQERFPDHEETPDNEGQTKKLGDLKVLLCKDDSWKNFNIGFTWAKAAPGDMLCTISDGCCLILRENGPNTSIIGPAWVSVSEERDSGWVYEAGIDYWVQQFHHKYAKGESDQQFDQNAIQLCFNVWELIRLLQVNEKMHSILFDADGKLKGRSLSYM
jgi:hypothetical protein